MAALDDNVCLPFVNSFDMPNAELLKRSDDVICNNNSLYEFNQQKKNDLMMCWAMNGCILPENKNIDAETKLWRSGNGSECLLELYKVRGGNSKDMRCNRLKPQYTVKAGYDNYSGGELKDYLMVPCKVNNFRNHLDTDSFKTCSIRHQLFMNNTSRK